MEATRALISLRRRHTLRRRYYTPSQIFKTLRRCEQVGINCWQASFAGEVELHRRYVDEGGQMQMIVIEAGTSSHITRTYWIGGDLMRTFVVGWLLIGVGTLEASADESISLCSLLHDMSDPDALARWPQPVYRQLQASSYNRASKVRGGPGWFADSDGVGFLRREQHGDHTEWVLMEHDGPGAIARIWTPFFYYDFNERIGPNVRIYLDGADEPVIDCPLIELVRAQQFVGEPFSAHTARAGDLYLPIPFASGCKVTMLRKPFYNIINYRAYPEGSRVETFTMEALEAAAPKLEAIGHALLHPPTPNDDRLTTVTGTLAPNGDMTIPVPEGSAAIRYLEIQLTPGHKGRTTHLRSTILTARFDNEPAVWCPLGDFFGSADAIHPFKSFAREAAVEGTLICRWVMPYEKSAELKLVNLGSEPVDAHVRMAAGPWQWDGRSMHFHANWRPNDIVPGSPFLDWNFIEITGQGVLVGDQWTVLNPNGGWWGEGDEKIYIDDDFQRNFPSHFGTGTEDYYGWAGDRVPTRDDEFSHPFLSNIRVGGLDGGTRGWNICTRQRGLDAVPFAHRLRFDIEASFGVGIRNPWNLLAYSAVTWWYARPGAAHNCPSSPEAAVRPITSLEELDRRSKEIRDRQTRRVEGAIELEDLKPTARSEGLSGGRQVPHARFHPDRFSGRAHYFVSGRRTGDFVEFTIPEQYKPRRVVLHLVRSFDFGIVQLSVNGRKVGSPIDLYESDPATISQVDLGEVTPAGNTITLRVELVDRNPQSRGSGTFFGLDCVELKAP